MIEQFMQTFEIEVGLGYGLLLLAGLTIVKIAWSSWKNPLRSLPGEWHTLFSDFPSRRQQVNSTRVKHIHELHEKYGPIVRTGTNSVDIVTPQAVRRIYNAREDFIKWAPMYKGIADRESESVFSVVDVHEHRRMRRQLGQAMSESNMRTLEPTIKDHVDKVLLGMAKEAEQRGCVDVLKWWTFMTTDVIGVLSFGESFRMLDVGEPTQYSRDVASLGDFVSFRIAWPTIHRLLKRYTPDSLNIPMLTEPHKINIRLRQYAQASLGRYAKLLSVDPVNTPPSLLSRLIASQAAPDKSNVDSGETPLSSEEIISNAQSFIAAGTDTTAQSLTYLVWELCRHPHIRDALAAELRTVVSDPDDLQDDQLRGLPLLNHVIQESIRLHPIVPFGLPRVVPAGGFEFEGHFLPAGTVVSSQIYTLGRDEKVYPEAHLFKPERWENPTREMKDMYMQFGGGSRICIGIHLAKLELRLAVAGFVLKFPNARISAREGMTDADMETVQDFLSHPKGKRCLVDVN